MATAGVQTMQITLPVKKVLTVPSSKRIPNRSSYQKLPEISSVNRLFQLKDGGAVTVSADNDLTNLNWLQKPHVLNSLCTPLAESPARVRAMRRMPSKRTSDTKTNVAINGERYDSDKAFDSILAVRNRRTASGKMPTKPPLSFACMIFMAIESSPDRMLPVREIYNWIMKKFPFFRTASPGWKNSVRHNLSLNKCFRKVEKSRNSPSASPVSKGSCWAVDKEYRKCLLTALKRTPYHPYHQYFTPSSDGCVGLSGIEAISIASSKPFDTAEKEAAFTMCMISNTPDRNTTPVTPIILHAIELDHSYAKKPPKSRGLSLADVAAAASLLHFQNTLEESAGSPCSQHSDGRESIESSDSDELHDVDNEYEFNMESEEELEVNHKVTNKLENSLSDSGYVDASPQLLELAKHITMEELGVNALLHLANSPALTANCNSNNSNTPSISPFSLEQSPPKFTSTPTKDSIQVMPIHPHSELQSSL